MEKLRLLELFSGLGSQAKAFERVNCFNTEVVATADLDKDVVVDYAAIHCGLTNEMIENYSDYPNKEEMIKELTEKRIGYDFVKDKPYNWEKLAKKKDKTKGIERYWLANKFGKNLGDITQIKSLPDTDVLFFSSPCTDWSLSGRQAGGDWTCLDCGHTYNPQQYDVHERYTCPECGSHNIKSTRSGLLFEVERLLVDYQKRDSLPKYLVLENVPALVSKKFIDYFNDWLYRLEALGYNNYWSLINAKDTGVPQNRERVFCISIRKDIDTGKFEFPKQFDLGIRLKDVLEEDDSILEKYFLSDEIQARLKITDPELKKSVIGTTLGEECGRFGNRDAVYNKDGIMGALTATDYKQPKQILVSNECIQSATMMGKYEKMMDISRRVYDEEGISPTLHCVNGGGQETKISRNNLKVVRKLTPLETFRLQDFDDNDYKACKDLGMSDTHAYHATGNSICVKCIELIAEHLYKAQYDENYECFDEKVLSNISNFTSKTENNILDDKDIYSAASRGRYKEDGTTEQHLEINKSGYANAITTVQKDSYVVEID